MPFLRCTDTADGRKKLLIILGFPISGLELSKRGFGEVQAAIDFMIKNPKDFGAGVFYIALGLFGACTLGDNELGTLARMGPGYFPFIISCGLMLTGLAIALKALVLAPAEPALGRIELGRPAAPLLILGSAALYAVTLLTLGFALSISLMVIVSSLAHPLFRLRDAIISAVVLTTLSALLFVNGLGLIVPMWPVFF